MPSILAKNRLISIIFLFVFFVGINYYNSIAVSNVNKTQQENNKSLKNAYEKKQIFKKPVEENNPKFLFLKNLKTLRTKYIQTEYTKTGEIKTDGIIIIKKPNSVLVEHRGKNMNIKMSYVSNNLKVVDFDLGQTTFLDSKYGELMQFFTNSIDNKKMFLNNVNELCVEFKIQDNQLYACLNIDESDKQDNRKLKELNMYMYGENKNNEMFIGKIMNIIFHDTKTNENVDDGEFFLKDIRIFEDD